MDTRFNRIVKITSATLSEEEREAIAKTITGLRIVKTAEQSKKEERKNFFQKQAERP